MRLFILALWAYCASEAQAQYQGQYQGQYQALAQPQAQAQSEVQAQVQTEVQVETLALPLTTSLSLALPTSLSLPLLTSPSLDLPTSLPLAPPTSLSLALPTALSLALPVSLPTMPLPMSLSWGQSCTATTLTVGQVTSLEYAFSTVNNTVTGTGVAGGGTAVTPTSSSSPGQPPLPSIFPGCDNGGNTGTGLQGYGYDIFCDQGAGAGSVIEEVLKKRTAVSYADCVTSCSADILCVAIAWDSTSGTCTKYSLITSVIAGALGVNIIYKSVALAAVSSSLSAAAAATRTTTRTTTTTRRTTTTTTTTIKTTTTTKASTTTTTTTTTSASASPTVASCGVNGYDLGTNIGYYADPTLANYFSCSSLCNANANCQTFAINPAAPFCILYNYSISLINVVPASPNIFYTKGGVCPSATTTTTTSYSPTPTGKWPFCPASLSPYNITAVGLGTQQPYAGCITGKSGSACMHDVSGTNYCNDCISCDNGWACKSDADCPANYACIVGSACPKNGTTGAAMCLYMLYDPAHNCYADA